MDKNNTDLLPYILEVIDRRPDLNVGDTVFCDEVKCAVLKEHSKAFRSFEDAVSYGVKMASKLTKRRSDVVLNRLKRISNKNVPSSVSRHNASKLHGLRRRVNFSQQCNMNMFKSMFRAMGTKRNLKTQEFSTNDEEATEVPETVPTNEPEVGNENVSPSTSVSEASNVETEVVEEESRNEVA